VIPYSRYSRTVVFICSITTPSIAYTAGPLFSFAPDCYMPAAIPFTIYALWLYTRCGSSPLYHCTVITLRLPYNSTLDTCHGLRLSLPPLYSATHWDCDCALPPSTTRHCPTCMLPHTFTGSCGPRHLPPVSLHGSPPFLPWVPPDIHIPACGIRVPMQVSSYTHTFMTLPVHAVSAWDTIAPTMPAASHSYHHLSSGHTCTTFHWDHWMVCLC